MLDKKILTVDLYDCRDKFITYNVCRMITTLKKKKIAHNFGSGQYFLMKLSGCVHNA